MGVRTQPRPLSQSPIPETFAPDSPYLESWIIFRGLGAGGSVNDITERIASASPTHIVLALVLLTLLRALLSTTKVRFFRACAEVCDSAIIAITLVFLIVRPFLMQSFFIPSGSMHPTLWEDDHILVNKWVYRAHAPERGDIVVFRSPKLASNDETDFIKRVVGLPGDTIEVREGFVVVGAGDQATMYTRDALYSYLCAAGCPVSGTDSIPAPQLRLTTDGLWLGDRRVSPEQFAVLVDREGEPVVIQPGRVLRNNAVLTESYVAEDPQYYMNPVVVPPGELFVLGDNRNDSRDSHVWGTFPAGRVIGRADVVFWPPTHLKKITP